MERKFIFKKAIPFILIAILFITCAIYVMCRHTSDESINTLKVPDRINMYYYGEQKELVESPHKVSQDMFTEIYKLIVFQMPEVVGVDTNSGVTDDEIEEVKTYAVEYRYDKLQEVMVNRNGNITQIQYKEMLFSMNGKYENNVYIKTEDNSYIFVGTRPDIKIIIKNMF